jgi:hypothetical protein
MADDANPRAVIGANFPPVDPFDAFCAHFGDLRTEAGNWLDGSAIETQAQADEVSRLMDHFRQSAKDADKARAEEKRPHDEAAKAVQAKWKPLLETAELAIDACKKTLAPWLQRLETEKRAAAEAARVEAEEKAAAAAAAMRAASPTDIGAREAAEALTDQAKRAQMAANRAEKDRAHASGGNRATTLRSHFSAVLTDPKAALLHYVAQRPDDIKACLCDLARQDVAGGKRTIPGFTVAEERRVV